MPESRSGYHTKSSSHIALIPRPQQFVMLSLFLMTCFLVFDVLHFEEYGQNILKNIAHLGSLGYLFHDDTVLKVLGRKATEVKQQFHHITLRAHAANIHIITVDIDQVTWLG